jgi:hypothetical protein
MASQEERDDGRFLLGWCENRLHDGVAFELTHAFVAWNASQTNIQLLMFQVACPLSLSTSSKAIEARAFAQLAARDVEFYPWRECP